MRLLHYSLILTAVVAIATPLDAENRNEARLEDRDARRGRHCHRPSKSSKHHTGYGPTYGPTTVPTYAPTYGTGTKTTTATTTTIKSSSSSTTTKTSSTSSSSTATPTSDPGNSAQCQTLLVPKPNNPSQPWIFTGGYRGYGNRTYTEPTTPLPMLYFDGDEPVCTAAAQCGDFSVNNQQGRIYSDFELRKQLSSNQWVCIAWAYHFSAINFTVVDPDVGAAYEWALL